MIASLRADVEQRREQAAQTRTTPLVGDPLELEDVLAETFRAARRIARADAAFVSIRRTGGEPFFAASGLTREEAAQHALAGLPASRGTTSVSIQYRYRDPAASCSRATSRPSPLIAATRPRGTGTGDSSSAGSSRERAGRRARTQRRAERPSAE